MTDQNSLEQFDQRLVALFHDVTNVSPDSPKYDPNILRSPMADALDDPDITEEEMVLYREWLRQDVAHQRKFIASLVQSSIRMQSSVVPAAQKLMRLEEEAIDKMLSFFSESNEGLLIDTLNGNISPEVLQAAEEFLGEEVAEHMMQKNGVIQHLAMLYQKDKQAVNWRAELSEITDGYGMDLD